MSTDHCPHTQPSRLPGRVWICKLPAHPHEPDQHYMVCVEAEGGA